MSMKALGRFSQISRNFVTSAVKRSSHDGYGPQRSKQSIVPFDIQNPYKFSVIFALYFGSAFSFPFLMVRYRLTSQ